jgi:serine/threonine protein kinase
MSLVAGSKLGPYEILAPIGKGGMGEVYRARDPRLNRDVAVKVSAAQFTERFEREAKAIAALNHPNICQIYDVGPNYLVMEYIAGESPKGPMRLEEALRIALQIAAALEAAHDKGIVHRDLKPANIKIKLDGTVKVLDFGLAKQNRNREPAWGEDANTLTMTMTEAGVIVGTAAYMAPEQALGNSNVDKRADIWAFGVVLYKLLTGKNLFTGEEVSDILASVIRDEPDLSGAPAEVQPLLKRCLEKDPAKRLRDIGDLELLVGMQVSPARDPRRWIWMASTAALLVGLAALAFLHFRETAPPEQTLRYSIVPEADAFDFFAISPNGRSLVTSAWVKGKRQLWLRPMDALQAQPIPFTEDGSFPFWSPDSRYIGFFAQGKLKKVAAAGGQAQSLCDVPSARGGSWSRDDVIVFSPNNSGISIQRVPAVGGDPVDVTRTKGIQRLPVFLPDGQHFLYLAREAAPQASGIFVSSLDGQENRRILADVSGMIFAPPARGEQAGHLLFVRDNTLMAVPFDPVSAQVSGAVFPVADGVSLGTPNSYLPATVSDNGVLVYVTGGIVGSTNQIGRYDRSGKPLGPVGMLGAVFDPALSPNEKLVAFSRSSGAGSADLWIHDLDRGTEARFTNVPSSNASPVWSPNGDRVVFGSNRNGVYNLFEKTSGGGGQDELLLPNSAADMPSQWSRDGRYIVYFEFDPKNKRDLWVLPVEGGAEGRKPIPFLRTPFDESMGQLSPDNHWMAFASDQSGRREVYVRPFPQGQAEWAISAAGGQSPRWSHDSKELFFLAADGKMMAVPVRKALPGPKSFFEVGSPEMLFDAHMVRTSTTDTLFEYDVYVDGKRFLINTTSVASAPPLTVVTNWLAGAKK